MSLKDRLKEVQESHREDVDWEQRKDEWVNNVNRLYHEVKEWLDGLKNEDLMSFDTHSVVRSEPMIGDYQIPQLILALPKEPSIEIVFDPIGRNVVGALGRVDVYPRGLYGQKYMLILVDRANAGTVWELWKSKYARDRRPFDKQALEEIIEEWLNEITHG
ncbi:MAG TPA: hypothetical protein VMV10_01725 [Pirellulales bacterium]|nr:hypothetical protein [Pirellulales bacterium]